MKSAKMKGAIRIIPQLTNEQKHPAINISDLDTNRDDCILNKHNLKYKDIL